VSRNRTTTLRRHRRTLAVAGLVAAQAAAGAGWTATAQAAPSTTRVSVSSAGQQGNAASGGSISVSRDGTLIAFSSVATNFASGITEGQVYVRDKTRGTTEIVSTPTGGGLPNGDALEPSISEDGRFVAFRSEAANLVPGDTNGTDDVFVKDRVTGVTTRISVSGTGAQGNGFSGAPAISGDGRFVAFHSAASNLVLGDTNGFDDIFVKDRTTGTITRASLSATRSQSKHHSSFPSISRDGSRVTFESAAANLVGSDGNSTTDVFVADQRHVLLRASSDPLGNAGDLSSRDAEISADGRSVVYESRATTLVPGDTNARTDIYRHDVLSRVTTLVSKAAGGGLSNGDSRGPAISADGRRVAYNSAATNLVGRDANGATLDVFVTDLAAPAGAQNTLVSVATGGAAADGASAGAALSANGLVTAYRSSATNLVSGDTNRVTDVFARTS
jgi:Tol biopolymer transport system component